MSAFPQICVVCGDLFQPKGSENRCPDHNRQYQRELNRRKDPRRKTWAWKKLRAQVLAGNPPCHYCGNPADQVDHVIPLAKGGQSTLENLVPCCGPCNRAKGDRILPGH